MATQPTAVFMAFGTKGDVYPTAAIAAAFADDQVQYRVTLATHVALVTHAAHEVCGNQTHDIAKVFFSEVLHFYRDSKLTRLLQSSLSGHGHVSLICTITPASSNMEETHNTLKFASRAKRVEIYASRNKVGASSAGRKQAPLLLTPFVYGGILLVFCNFTERIRAFSSTESVLRRLRI